MASGRLQLFVLRDDDTNFFTRPEQLEAVYGRYWDEVPVTLAVVPFHASTRSKAIPAQHWEGDKTFPLHENRDLVSYLKEQVAQGRVEIALHGYNHKNYPGGFEFEVADDLDGRICKGRAYLEDLFQTRISVFVPPHNAASKRALQALDRAGLNVLGSFLSFHPNRKPWDHTTLGNYLRLSLYRIRLRKPRGAKIVYPFPLRYRNHAEFGCHNLIPQVSAASLLLGLNLARQAGGDFCLATHYWEIDQRLREELYTVLETARADSSIRFVPARELFGSRGSSRRAG